MTLVRTREWKLVHYLDQDFGELYDLMNDPGEPHSAWNEPAHDRVKQGLLAQLRNWRVRTSNGMA